MTNEMSKRFREINKEMLWVADEEVDDVLFFLQSEIDLAVAEERKRIVEEIEKAQKTIRLEQYTVDTILSLINKTQ